jgi:hypothetical protein
MMQFVRQKDPQKLRDYSDTNSLALPVYYDLRTLPFWPFVFRVRR